MDNRTKEQKNAATSLLATQIGVLVDEAKQPEAIVLAALSMVMASVAKSVNIPEDKLMEALGTTIGGFYKTMNEAISAGHIFDPNSNTKVN